MPYRSAGYLLDYVGSFLRLRILSKEDKRKYDFICLGENAGSTLPFFSMWKKVSATCIDKVHVHSKPWMFTWGPHGNVRTWHLDDMPGLGVSLSFLSFLSFCQGTSQPSRAVGAWTSPKQRERFHRVQSASAQHDVAHIVTGLHCIVVNLLFDFFAFACVFVFAYI